MGERDRERQRSADDAVTFPYTEVPVPEPFAGVIDAMGSRWNEWRSYLAKTLPRFIINNSSNVVGLIQLVAEGIVLAKFWLAISKDEQLRRFQDREKTPYKRYKITAEDWRNREKWDAYALAVGDMVDRTSSESAPWTLIASEDKFHGRVKILRTIVERLEAAL